MQTRRDFVRQCLAGGLASLACGWVPAGFAVEDRTPKAWNGRLLLVIVLRGGNDAVNAVIPAADPAYSAALRPGILIPKPILDFSGQCPVAPDLSLGINLGNGFAALHPALRDLGPIYNAGDLALVHRVGYPNLSRSHFSSQRYWETGTVSGSETGEGVLYRAVMSLGLDAALIIPAVSTQERLPQLLQGPGPIANIDQPERYDLLGVYADSKQKQIDALQAAHGTLYPAKAHRDQLFGTGGRFFEQRVRVGQIDFAGNAFYDADGTTHLFPIDATSNEAGFAEWAFPFFRRLKNAVQFLLTGEVAIAVTELQSFDTHSDQGGVSGKQADMLRLVGWGFHAARTVLSDHGAWDDSVVLAFSEFGRESVQNGSGGTDHGEAGALLLAGGRVNGGVYQCDAATWPTGPAGALFAASGRYLGRTVDYRSVFGELVRDHLGATGSQLAAIIAGYADPSQHLLTGGTAPDGVPIVGELGLIQTA